MASSFCEVYHHRATSKEGDGTHLLDRGTSWNHSEALYPMHDWRLAMYELFPGEKTFSVSLIMMQFHMSRNVRNCCPHPCPV